MRVCLLLAALAIAAPVSAQQRLRFEYVISDYRFVETFSIKWDGVGNTWGRLEGNLDRPLSCKLEDVLCIQSFEFPMPALSPGLHELEVGACDAFGSCASSTVKVWCTATTCINGWGLNGWGYPFPDNPDAPPPPPPPPPTGTPPTAPTVRSVWSEAPTTGGESDDQTRVPPSLQLRDATGAVWTLAGTGPTKSVVRNGVGVGSDGVELRYVGHTVYLGTGGWFYRWDGTRFVSFGATAP